MNHRMQLSAALIVLLAPGSAVLAGEATSEPPKFPRELLDGSPRHHEWVKIGYGDRVVEAFVAYPQVKEKAPGVIVIHENKGLTDWVRSVADRLAEAGVIAIAPDLLSGMGPGSGKPVITSVYPDMETTYEPVSGGTGSFPSEDDAKKAIYALPPEQVTADLEAVLNHLTKDPACNGKLAVAGFCWGGSQSFRFATNPSLSAAYVFYGTGPDSATIAGIECPVYGFYGGDDARVTASVPESQKLMKAAGKKYEPVTYEDAGHGFMRSGESEGATAENVKAHAAAWERWKALLAKL